jgi:predicted acyl esterase
MVCGRERPPHLVAILPWQGTYDFYRDRTRQDGIYASGFLKRWWNRSVLRNQHGNPDSDCRDIYTGERVTGPANLSQTELAANRADYLGDVLAHPLNDSFYRERTPDLSKIDYPALVIANWAGLGLHLRGTIRGYMGIASREKKMAQGPIGLIFSQLSAAAERGDAETVLRPLPQRHRQRLAERTIR